MDGASLLARSTKMKLTQIVPCERQGGAGSQMSLLHASQTCDAPMLLHVCMCSLGSTWLCRTSGVHILDVPAETHLYACMQRKI